jgi:hypothetical protein
MVIPTHYRPRLFAIFALGVLLLLLPLTAHAQCTGDCNLDGQVTVDEIVTAVNIGLGMRPVGDCLAADSSGDGQVTVDEIVTTVNNALNGCPISGGWTLQNPLPTINDLYAVDYINPQEGWVVGGFGLILHTTDGGQNWDVQDADSEADLFGVDFVDSQNGWAVGYDPETDEPAIFKTTNGGATWAPREIATAVVLTAVSFVDARTPILASSASCCAPPTEATHGSCRPTAPPPRCCTM